MSAPKLGDILIHRGVIDEEKLIAALSDQRAFGGKLGRTLVDLGYVTEDQLVGALSEQLGLETVNLDTAEIDAEALSVLPLDACERYGVFPVRVDTAQRVLWIATAEPDRAMLQEVAQIAQYTLEPVLSSMSAIDRAVRQYYFGEKHGPKAHRGEPLTAIPGDAPAPAPRPVPGRRADDEDVPEASIVEGEGLTGVAPLPAPDAVEEVRVLLHRIEKAVTAQGRAFRALVELLQEKGVVRRGELGSRTTRTKPG
jgi:type IV pilus assembly protein PilB